MFLSYWGSPEAEHRSGVSHKQAEFGPETSHPGEDPVCLETNILSFHLRHSLLILRLGLTAQWRHLSNQGWRRQDKTSSAHSVPLQHGGWSGLRNPYTWMRMFAGDRSAPQYCWASRRPLLENNRIREPVLLHTRTLPPGSAALGRFPSRPWTAWDLFFRTNLETRFRISVFLSVFTF